MEPSTGESAFSEVAPLPPALDDDAVVVRGGTLNTPEGLVAARNNALTVYRAYGRYGLCVSAARPDEMTVEELVRARPIKNGMLSPSVVSRLKGAGYPVTEEPGAGHPKGAAIVWLPGPDTDTLKGVAALLDDPIPNPVPPAERRLL